eukprot:CAMPEP_0198270146 /NCGR_PEP_ID=MMETSP1447-20131203/43949_1 /TAXON_ID=420782 /ORGANISM="Chaetoceros dichaeta, Strain CCMP1751" /LENGTH=121 /DNA_ID=CAMNT_0043962033 /DNA_START=57 /DNA_END=422 /DNA_ORIENTATION=+
MSAQEVATAFVAHFYSTFDTNPDGLAGLYSPASNLTFEGTQHVGMQAIMEKLKGIGAVKHTIKSTDLQPSASSNAIIVFVTGSIQIGGDNALHFCESFQLVSTAPGAYYVHNDIFRLNYGL